MPVPSPTQYTKSDNRLKKYNLHLIQQSIQIYVHIYIYIYNFAYLLPILCLRQQVRAADWNSTHASVRAPRSVR